jgi:small-conductance mechanosensitive channel
MTDPIMDPKTFDIVITVLIALGVFWVMLDLFYITRVRGKDLKEAAGRDKLFGYIIGISIGVFVTIGILRHHGVV